VYELTLEGILHIDHALRLYDGILEPMHHHDWVVDVTVASEDLDQIGAVMDFFELDRILREVLADLDGKVLNDHPAFRDRNSSSEIVTRYLFDQIEPKLPAHARLRRVTVHRHEEIRAHFTYSR
jgi:6-pyruvoyltetrahydropterin/6-carboxytetrahydropterin synthase